MLQCHAWAGENIAANYSVFVQLSNTFSLDYSLSVTKLHHKKFHVRRSKTKHGCKARENDAVDYIKKENNILQH